MENEEIQKEALNEVLMKLNKEHPNLYYENTSSVAKMLYDFIHNPEVELKVDNVGLLGALSEEDIRYKLSFMH